jgi:hypothetical protein
MIGHLTTSDSKQQVIHGIQTIQNIHSEDSSERLRITRLPDDRGCLSPFETWFHSKDHGTLSLEVEHCGKRSTVCYAGYLCSYQRDLPTEVVEIVLRGPEKTKAPTIQPAEPKVRINPVTQSVCFDFRVFGGCVSNAAMTIRNLLPDSDPLQWHLVAGPAPGTADPHYTSPKMVCVRACLDNLDSAIPALNQTCLPSAEAIGAHFSEFLNSQRQQVAQRLQQIEAVRKPGVDDYLFQYNLYFPSICQYIELCKTNTKPWCGLTDFYLEFLYDRYRRLDHELFLAQQTYPVQFPGTPILVPLATCTRIASDSTSTSTAFIKDIGAFQVGLSLEFAPDVTADDVVTIVNSNGTLVLTFDNDTDRDTFVENAQTQLQRNIMIQVNGVEIAVYAQKLFFLETVTSVANDQAQLTFNHPRTFTNLPTSLNSIRLSSFDAFKYELEFDLLDEYDVEISLDGKLLQDLQGNTTFSIQQLSEEQPIWCIEFSNAYSQPVTTGITMAESNASNSLLLTFSDSNERNEFIGNVNMGTYTIQKERNVQVFLDDSVLLENASGENVFFLQEAVASQNNNQAMLVFEPPVVFTNIPSNVTEVKITSRGFRDLPTNPTEVKVTNPEVLVFWGTEEDGEIIYDGEPNKLADWPGTNLGFMNMGSMIDLKNHCVANSTVPGSATYGQTASECENDIFNLWFGKFKGDFQNHLINLEQKTRVGAPCRSPGFYQDGRGQTFEGILKYFRYGDDGNAPVGYRGITSNAPAKPAFQFMGGIPPEADFTNLPQNWTFSFESNKCAPVGLFEENCPEFFLLDTQVSLPTLYERLTQDSKLVLALTDSKTNCQVQSGCLKLCLPPLPATQVPGPSVSSLCTGSQDTTRQQAYTQAYKDVQGYYRFHQVSNVVINEKTITQSNASSQSNEIEDYIAFMEGMYELDVFVGGENNGDEYPNVLLSVSYDESTKILTWTFRDTVDATGTLQKNVNDLGLLYIYPQFIYPNQCCNLWGFQEDNTVFGRRNLVSSSLNYLSQVWEDMQFTCQEPSLRLAESRCSASRTLGTAQNGVFHDANGNDLVAQSVVYLRSMHHYYQRLQPLLTFVDAVVLPQPPISGLDNAWDAFKENLNEFAKWVSATNMDDEHVVPCQQLGQTYRLYDPCPTCLFTVANDWEVPSSTDPISVSELRSRVKAICLCLHENNLSNFESFLQARVEFVEKYEIDDDACKDTLVEYINTQKDESIYYLETMRNTHCDVLLHLLNDNN